MYPARYLERTTLAIDRLRSEHARAGQQLAAESQLPRHDELQEMRTKVAQLEKILNPPPEPAADPEPGTKNGHGHAAAPQTAQEAAQEVALVRSTGVAAGPLHVVPSAVIGRATPAGPSSPTQGHGR